jgi:uncharacterized protein
MEPIYIPHLLQANPQQRVIAFETQFTDLPTLMPVRGQISVKHCHTYLAIQGTAETIVTLTCDRCLQQYNHRLTVDATEMIWLQALNPAAAPLEQEVASEDLVESLSPQGHFEPATWMYEQLCLALPQRQICDPACGGIAVAAEPPAADALGDRRWAALAALKANLPDG